MERKKSEEDDENAKQRGKAAASAPAPRKRKRSDADDGGASGAGGGAMCDDVVGNILARLPARDAVACMALSKHHRRLIRSPEFTDLHRRLAPPLPRPHVAYVVTTPIKRGPGTGTVSRFHGFHVAGGGLSGGGTNAPMRALAGARYLHMAYVNTCNGVVLLAKKEFSSSSSSSCRCTLWNPAIADGVKEVTVPASPERHCLVLGLGYAGRSETYKMLLCHKDMSRSHSLLGGVKKCFNHHKCRVDYSLVIYELGNNTNKELRLQTIISAQPFLEFSPKSLYLDGTIYLLHFVDKTVMLAFDMDNETVSTIKFPPGDPGQANYWFTRPVLMEVSGHLCVVTNEAHHQKALWFLTVDHKWEQRYLIGTARDIGYTLSDFYNWLVVGVWDCHGVLVLYLHGSGQSHLCLYHAETKKMFKAKIPWDLVPSQSGYEWSWGYRPTLVSPGSIVGKLDEDWEQRRDRSADMMLALKPINDQDMKQGCKMTLSIVCLMDFLVRIMRKLPDDMQDVVGMPLMDSEDPIFFSEDALYSDSD